MLVRVSFLILVLGGASSAGGDTLAHDNSAPGTGHEGLLFIQAEEKKQPRAPAEEGKPAPAPDAKPATEAAPDAVPEAAPDAAPVPKPAADALPDRGTILKNLSHEEFKHRVAAQQALLQWGSKDLDRGIETLFELYRNSDDPEIRMRSREVLKRLVIIKQPFEGSGYLGIQMEPDQWKNKAGEIVPAVRVTIVREGTAAEVAKLKANDIVTGVDDVQFNELLPTRSFADYIQSKKPGDIITLHVNRGGQTLDLKASLRRRSPLLNRLSQFGTQLELPAQAELDESDFQDWLKSRSTRERKSSK